MLKKEISRHTEFSKYNDNVFMYVVDMNTRIKDINKFWRCLSNEEKVKANQFYTRELIDRYIIGFVASIFA